ncbi:hypothetical protein Rhe02_09230 [Rhizocola hellebori]|uniref:N-acetyltransferase domain-containing protein n=2 Tax=Rhizocola hellebori TaxID=1392758 RepID=A0A8J3Q3S0_9ACTN|nr:hypothetical protein Rhe02_09230 [Rhizocola hellebori]
MSGSSDTVIRSIEEDDIEACAAIFVKAYAEVYGETWSVQTAEARITHVVGAGRPHCLVIEGDGAEVMGFLLARPYPWYDGIRLWIEEIVIETRYRGIG